MRTLMILMALVLGAAGAAHASDPCDGRNPLYCTPLPGPLVIERPAPPPREGRLFQPHRCAIRDSPVVGKRDGRVIFISQGRCLSWIYR